MKNALLLTLILVAALLSTKAMAADSAREILDKSQASLSSGKFSRIDTTRQSAVVKIGKKRARQKPQTSVLKIDIDMAEVLARYTTTVQGKNLVMIKCGQKAAMQLGDGPWEVPAGPYTTMAKDMGNLFVCEMETPETEKNAPTWKLREAEVLEGEEVYVIETEGNTAVTLAEERMNKGITKSMKDQEHKMTAKVKAYSAKRWIRKSDYRPYKVVQTSKYQMLIDLPDGKRQTMDISQTSTSEYCYDKTDIVVPEDAKVFLFE